VLTAPDAPSFNRLVVNPLCPLDLIFYYAFWVTLATHEWSYFKF